jgi:hypothetical protein
MNVQFEEESFDTALFNETPDQPQGLAGALMKLGVVKNGVQANMLFIVLSIACIGAAVFVVSTNTAAAPIGPQAEDFYKQGRAYVPGMPLR